MLNIVWSIYIIQYYYSIIIILRYLLLGCVQKDITDYMVNYEIFAIKFQYPYIFTHM